MAGEGASWPRRWATSMVLPNPASPATTIPETSAVRIMTTLPSSAHPSHQDSMETGAMPDRSIRAGARLLGMAGGLASPQPPAEQVPGKDEHAAAQDHQQPEADQQPDQARQRDGAHQRVHSGRRRRLMSSPSQQRSTSSPSPSSAS